MTFASPAFFWALLSLIPLVAIYLLKVRPKRKPTTAYFLWNDIFQEKKATSLFQRFRDLLSLLLMAMAFLAVVFALVRPDFSGDQQKDLILLIDNSASMSVNEGASSRLELAKTAARQMVRALNGRQRCSVATVSDQARVLSHLTDNPKELLDAIDRIEASSLPSRVQTLDQFLPAEEESELASTIDEQQELEKTQSEDVDDSTVNNDDSETKQVGLEDAEHRVVLISDGIWDKSIPEAIELHKVGSDVGNIGIVAADLERLPNGQVGFFFQLASSFEKTVEAELVVSQGTKDNIVKLIPLEVVAGINEAEVFELPEAEAGRWFAEVEFRFTEDALAADNVAYLTLPPKRPIGVSVGTKDRYFYENSVLAFSKTGGLLQLVSGDDPKSQLVILQGNQMSMTGEPDSDASLGSTQVDSNDRRRDLLIFQPEGKSPWWETAGEEVIVTVPRAVDESHPVVRHLNVSAMSFIGARRLTVPAGAEVLVVAEDDTPLIYRVSRAGQNAVIVNMNPVAADFFLSAMFPVVVYSSATHLAGRSEAIPSTLPTGEYAKIPGAGIRSPESKMVDPAGKESTTRSTLLGPMMMVGHYEVDNDGGNWTLGCSLIDLGETLVNNDQIKDTSLPINKGFSPASWLTLLALLVIVAESILYQRRKVG